MAEIAVKGKVQTELFAYPPSPCGFISIGMTIDQIINIQAATGEL